MLLDSVRAFVDGVEWSGCETRVLFNVRISLTRRRPLIGRLLFITIYLWFRCCFFSFLLLLLLLGLLWFLFRTTDGLAESVCNLVGLFFSQRNRSIEHRCRDWETPREWVELDGRETARTRKNRTIISSLPCSPFRLIKRFPAWLDARLIVWPCTDKTVERC